MVTGPGAICRGGRLVSKAHAGYKRYRLSNWVKTEIARRRPGDLNDRLANEIGQF